jgi:hypothetical protein
MKRKLLCLITAVTMTVITAWNISQNMSEEALSDVALANVEALAEENSECPNGCIAQANEWCFCYYYHENVREAHW